MEDIPDEQAKNLVAEYFKKHHGEEIDAADIQEVLGIEILRASQICEELEKEGKIKTA